MKRLLPLLVLFLLCALTAHAETMYVDGLDADRVHLRAAPDAQAESLGLYFTGAEAEALDASADWTLVRIGAETGWMQTKFLQGDSALRAIPIYAVQNPDSTWVNLREAPSMDAAVLMRCRNYMDLYVMGETASGWSYVEADGVNGYMVTDFLTSDVPERKSVTKIVGSTADGLHIHAYRANNGQTLYFTALEHDPFIVSKDVNFDGIEDLVVVTTLGASNFFSEFFVMADGQYVCAEHPGIDYGLCNYQLYPEQGIVVSHVNNGNAGAAHEYCLFRWNGTDLELLRRAVSEELTETEFTSDTFTMTTYHRILHIRVRDYTGGEYEGSTIWEATVHLDDVENGEVFEAEKEALWNGLK